MHKNEEVPEGYREGDREERKLGWQKGRNALGFKESGSGEREGGSGEDATTPTNF